MEDLKEINEIEFVVDEGNPIQEKKSKKKEIEYFTDEMHKEIFPFQEPLKSGYGGGKPISRFVKLTMKKNQ